MCKKIKIISETKNGSLIKCDCGRYHFTYNNLLFEFTENEIRAFKKFLASISVSYWKKQFSCAINCKSKIIPIPTNQGNLLLIFNVQEYYNLLELFFPKKNRINKLLETSEINYNFSEN